MQKLKNRIKDQANRLSMSEADTRALLIDPVLNALGWDLMDTGQVRREYNPYSDGTRGRSDYVLFIDGVPRVLVEAKKLGACKRSRGRC